MNPTAPSVLWDVDGEQEFSEVHTPKTHHGGSGSGPGATRRPCEGRLPGPPVGAVTHPYTVEGPRHRQRSLGLRETFHRDVGLLPSQKRTEPEGYTVRHRVPD